MSLTVDEAIARVKKRFPFEHYMDSQEGAYHTVGKILLHYLPAGSQLLDFGSGPCDKTAIAQELGYRCSACDDLGDDWHQSEDTKERIHSFARESGINFRTIEGESLPFKESVFDLIMMHDVLEHLHNSPRDLLNDLLCLLKEGGLFFTTVPNAVNIRKRIDVLRGKTNLPDFAGYYWYPGPWRGHIREYTRDDLIQLCDFLSLDIIELGNCHHMLHKLGKPLRPLYRAVTKLFPGWADSWYLMAKKTRNWKPRKDLPPSELKKIFGPDCPHYSYMQQDSTSPPND